MLSKTKDQTQMGFFLTLEDQLDSKHPLFILANQVEWKVFDQSFAKHYSATQGKPAKPIRLMVSLLILKQVRNLSDESIVEQWSENAYYQYFSGGHVFVPQRPCVATELVEFRKRIGREGIELILKESIRINGKDSDDDIISADTTVQEKNITYPTDDKLYKKIIHKCQAIATQEQVELRQSYTRTIKKLSILQRFRRNKGGDVKARKAAKKIKTIAGRQVRDLERKLAPDARARHNLDLELYKKVLAQKRSDSNKIYSLHEPQVKCYTKGKEHKKFEFGSKVSILLTQKTGVVVGALNFNDTLHDSKTLPQALEQYQRLTGREPKELFADRGYRGPKTINQTTIHTPKPDNNITKQKRKKHRRRAAIEPTIGHLKSDYRMLRNYLKGAIGDDINVMLAGAAMNFKRVMNLWKRRQIQFLETILFTALVCLRNYLCLNRKLTF